LSILKEELKKRKLPNLFVMNDGADCTKELWPKRRIELLNSLMKYCYGYTPAPPDKVTGTIIEEEKLAYAWKVTQQQIKIHFETPKGEFSFPVHTFLPNKSVCPPLIIHIAFRPVPDRYIPVEEITDNGFALAVVCYEDIIKDSIDGNFDQGLGAMYREKGPRRPDEWGKIGMWAFATSRVLDYFLTVDAVDKKHITVMGHSRLGKTALWCAAQDERFFCGISNNSGFGGAALAKYGAGEKISGFVSYGSSDWFCENFASFADKENELPYDQHFLLSTIAPRLIYVASAELDSNADPHSEFLSCFAASELYNFLGYDGLITPDNYPVAPISLHKGRIGYHIRKNHHFLSRYDWNKFCIFLHTKQAQD